VVHFYRNSLPCKAMDQHLALLAAKHMETKFVRVHAEKAPFLTGGWHCRGWLALGWMQCTQRTRPFHILLWWVALLPVGLLRRRGFRDGQLLWHVVGLWEPPAADGEQSLR
jgi:hypothetical protein